MAELFLFLFITIAAMTLLLVIGLKSLKAFFEDEEAQDEEWMDYCSTRDLKPWE